MRNGNLDDNIAVRGQKLLGLDVGQGEILLDRSVLTCNLALGADTIELQGTLIVEFHFAILQGVR